jgi:hypothetical protein
MPPPPGQMPPPPGQMPPPPPPPPIDTTPLPFERARIRLDSLPSRAEVRDPATGNLLGHTPFQFTLPASHVPRQFALHHKDYVDAVVEIIPERDKINLTEPLERGAPGQPPVIHPADPTRRPPPPGTPEGRPPPPGPGAPAPQSPSPPPAPPASPGRPDVPEIKPPPPPPRTTPPAPPPPDDDSIQLKPDPSRAGSGSGTP